MRPRPEQPPPPPLVSATVAFVIYILYYIYISRHRRLIPLSAGTHCPLRRRRRAPCRRSTRHSLLTGVSTDAPTAGAASPAAIAAAPAAAAAAALGERDDDAVDNSTRHRLLTGVYLRLKSPRMSGVVLFVS